MRTEKPLRRKSHLYFHINNGGISISLEDRPDGTVLIIESEHFGIQTNQMVLPVTPVTLREMGMFFKGESQQPCMAHQEHVSMHMENIWKNRDMIKKASDLEG
jgi:hypothetical protein